jgi:hypothetical protein
MKRTVLILAVLILLTSCAAGPQPKWYQSGKNQDDFNQDQYSCQQEASLYAASKRGRAYLELTNQEIVMGGLIGDERVLEQKRFKQCMENKGYQLK